MCNQGTGLLTMCFNSKAHTLLHRATLASHFMASRISPSKAEVLRAGSEPPQPAPQVGLCFLAKKVQTVSCKSLGSCSRLASSQCPLKESGKKS